MARADAPVLVRPAEPADVPAMSAVLTASIVELCGADHGGDAQRIAEWTANKTPQGVAGMLADPAQTLFVAERNGEIAAVGLVAGDRIGLNYVAPSHRFAGVSRALLSHMEAELKTRGIAVARLESTATALDFYRSAGWVETGGCAAGACRAMNKRL